MLLFKSQRRQSCGACMTKGKRAFGGCGWTHGGIKDQGFAGEHGRRIGVHGTIDNALHGLPTTLGVGEGRYDRGHLYLVFVQQKVERDGGFGVKEIFASCVMVSKVRLGKFGTTKYDAIHTASGIDMSG